MSGSLILESKEPVTFELDESAQHDKIDEFIDWVEHEYGAEMREFFAMNYDSILENKLSVRFEKYPAGMKLSRVLMQAFGSRAEEVRNHLAMLIQSNKITGKLCISVHPLDFLSASENQHSWRSCHALDGEYRSGNLSYMCDDVTFMAYLKSDEDTILPRFPRDVPWNNKKWRCFFFRDYDNGQIWAGRQYPFSTTGALPKIAELLWKLDYFAEDGLRDRFAGPGSYWGYNMPQFFCDALRGEVTIDDERPKMFNDTYVFLGQDQITLEPLRKYIWTPEEAMCYNDLIDSHTYAPYVLRYKAPYDYIPHNLKKFKVGSAAPCVCCNGNRNIEYSDTVLCRDCLVDFGPEDHEALTECDGCGQRIVREYAHYDEWGDVYYCDSCWEQKEPTPCGKCGCVYPKDRLKDYYPKNLDGLICKTCATNMNLREHKWFW